MKKALKGTYNVLRSVVVTALVTLVALAALAYLLLLLPPVQERVRGAGERALSEYLDTDVSIGSISIRPFDELILKQVNIPDQQGDSLIAIDKLGAGISLKHLLADRRVVVTYAEVQGLKGRVTRPDKDSPTNLQFIIDALKPKGDKPPKPFDVQVDNVVIRHSSLSYDVLDQPVRTGQLDANHLSMDNLRADVSLPRLKNNDFDIRVKRLAFDERSGLSVKRLKTNLLITDTALTASGTRLELPHSDITLDDVNLHYSSLKNLGKELPDMPLHLSTSGSTLTPADLAAVVPQLKTYDEPLLISATVNRNGHEIDVPVLSVHNTSGSLALDARGHVAHPTDAQQRSFALDRISLNAHADEITKATKFIKSLSSQARDLIAQCGNVNINGEAYGSRDQLHFDGGIGTSLGKADIDGIITHQVDGATHFAGQVKTDGLQLGRLNIHRDMPDDVALDAQVDATLVGKEITGHLNGNIAYVDFKGKRYHNVTADIEKQGNDFTGTLAMNDPNGKIDLDGTVHLDGKNSTYDVNVTTSGLSPAKLGLTDRYPQHRLSATATASLEGNTPNNMTGHINLNDIAFTNEAGQGITIDKLQINANNTGDDKLLEITSDHINGYVEGTYDYQTLVPTVKHILSAAFPQYFGDYATYWHEGSPNDLTFAFDINPDERLHKLLKSPVNLVYKTHIDGRMSESDNSFDLTVDAPYMLQGNKIIENTRLTARLDSASGDIALHAQSLYPSKGGKIALNLDATGADNLIGANLGWRVQRERDFHGNLDLSALLDRSNDGTIKAKIDVKPSQLVFNDTVWTVERGQIDVDHGTITVDNLAGGHDKQYVRINGKVSHDPDDVLCLELNDVSLDYVFQTLAIDHVNFGGHATSKFTLAT